MDSSTPKQIVQQTLAALDPELLLHQGIGWDELQKTLTVQGQTYHIDRYKRIIVIGTGKATYSLAVGLEKIIGAYIHDGWINIPHIPQPNVLTKIHAHISTHPIPTTTNSFGAEQIRRIAQEAGRDDLVIALISGGGSALAALPHESISLEDKIHVTKLLLDSGAPITEVNCVRKHLSSLKGGRLAALCSPATTLVLQISDVIGDDPSVIASGMFSPDATTYEDSHRVLSTYNLWEKVPQAVRTLIERGEKQEEEDTPNADHPCFRLCQTVTLGNHATAAQAAADACAKLGFAPQILTTTLSGEAREVGVEFIEQVKKLSHTLSKPTAFIASGETTVTVTGTGHGGRSQELALASVPHLEHGITLLAFGTDGVDGMTPTHAAGAAVDYIGTSRDLSLPHSVDYYLKNNDSYAAHKLLDTLIHTGPSGTNMGDVVIAIVDPK